MRQEYGKIEGNLTVTDELVLFGMCVGNIVVESGATLHLYGMCTGNINVRAGGKAILDGMCTGNVLNSGGVLEIKGTVTGALRKEAGTTDVDPNARIG